MASPILADQRYTTVAACQAKWKETSITLIHQYFHSLWKFSLYSMVFCLKNIASCNETKMFEIWHLLWEHIFLYNRESSMQDLQTRKVTPQK